MATWSNEHWRPKVLQATLTGDAEKPHASDRSPDERSEIRGFVIRRYTFPHSLRSCGLQVGIRP
jgi:hypothetical protein